MVGGFVDAPIAFLETAFRGDIDFTADDGLDAVFDTGLVEFDSAKHIAVVGDGHGRHLIFDSLFDQFIDTAGAVEETELRVEMEMDEIGVRHTLFLLGRLFTHSAPPVLKTTLFPLDGRRRLGTDIVDHAVDALDLINDPVGNLAEQFRGKLHPIRGHAIGT